MTSIEHFLPYAAIKPPLSFATRAGNLLFVLLHETAHALVQPSVELGLRGPRVERRAAPAPPPGRRPARARRPPGRRLTSSRG